MSKQIELALVSLMPTYGSDLPPTLVELAGSLLTQSRHLASTLKTEEEIARPYACAHIACDRLKIALDLPPIEPRPPIPPRVYKRLYTHLDNILPNASRNERASRTPRSKSREKGGSPGSQKRALPSRPTPSKEAALAQFLKQPGSTTTTPAKPSGQAHSNVRDSGLFPWVQSVIRYLCAESGNKRLAPSMLAGMESVLMPGGRRTEDAWALKNATALCAAIILFVAMRVKDLTPEQATNPEILDPARKEIIEQLNQARNEVTSKAVEGEALWEGWSEIKPKDFNTAVTQVMERGWLDADWYNDITDVMQFDQQPNAELDDGDSAAQVQSRRADTMLQDKYDLLSEARRADYKIWKDKILARISEKMAVAEAKETS